MLSSFSQKENPITDCSYENNTLSKGFLVLFLFILTNAQAQLQRTEFLNIGIKEGLSNSSVTCIVQDSIGFIWVGTKHGLNRYDGTNFKVYSQHQPYQIGNDISVLHIDSRNRLWVGTNSDGLFLYHPLNDTFQPISLEYSPGKVITIWKFTHCLKTGTD